MPKYSSYRNYSTEVKPKKEKTIKLNNKKLKLSYVEKLIKAGATIHISV